MCVIYSGIVRPPHPLLEFKHNTNQTPLQMACCTDLSCNAHFTPSAGDVVIPDTATVAATVKVTTTASAQATSSAAQNSATSAATSAVTVPTQSASTVTAGELIFSFFMIC